MTITLLSILTDNQKEQLYLDYLNNYITFERYAEYHKISEELALDIIGQGKEVNLRKGV